MTALDYTQLFEQPRHLTLEQESDQWWTVNDGDTVMVRADRALCERFIHAFVAKEPGASFDRAALEHSWRVAQTAGRRPSNVFPIRRRPLEPIDEVGA